MGGLLLQRRLAARILKVGETKIWIDKEHIADVKNAIIASDVRKMISHGYIKARSGKIKFPEQRTRKKRSPGKTRGKSGAIYPKKRQWINTVRPLRKMLRELRAEGKINSATYKNTYMLIKGGMFRSRAHLKLYLEQKGVKL